MFIHRELRFAVMSVSLAALAGCESLDNVMGALSSEQAAKVQEGGNESALPPSRERQIIQLIRTTDNIDGLCNAVEKGHAASPNEGEFSNQEVCATWRVMQDNQSGN